MYIVIWGAGVRGRRILHFIGKEKVKAFIDSRPEIQDTSYEGIPIISFKKYLKSYQGSYVVVTPIMGKERIINSLATENINRFMLLSDCPDNFYDYKYEELMKKLCSLIQESDIALYGINFYSILLAEALKEKEKNVTLIPCVGDNGLMCRNLMADGYTIADLDRLKTNISQVWLTTEISSDDFAKIKKSKLTYKIACNFEEIISAGVNDGLKKFNGIHKGKRCFVVATGPSLRVTDLDKLAETDEICISMNGIYHAFDKTNWRPNYFVVSDKAANLLAEHIDSINVKYKFVSDQSEEYWSENHPDNIYMFHTRFCERDLKFSEDFSVGTYTAGTVTYNCLQLAYYLGCNPIYLLGTDCNFDGYNKGKNAHFTKDYVFDNSLREGKKTPFTYVYTEEEQFQAQMRAYKAAKSFANSNGLRIINATRGGKLEVFDRVDFDSLF